MRTVWAMLGALMLGIIILDLGMVYVTYDKMSKVVEHSLDAAIVAGISEDDARLGKIYVNSIEAENAALTTFRENLNLDVNLENDIMKKTHLNIILHQDTDLNHPGTRPHIEAEVSTSVTAISPRLVGLDGVNISIKKIQFQLSDFK